MCNPMVGFEPLSGIFLEYLWEIKSCTELSLGPGSPSALSYVYV